MTSIEKLRKVINGLEDFIQCYRDAFDDGGEGVLVDVLELLKAQEPRVMTPTEIAALKENDIVWYEQHGTDGDFIAAMVADGREFIGNASMGVKLKYLDGSERLWTSRPTDEQREATRWR